MLNMIIITLAIIIQHAVSEEIINARTDSSEISTLINLNLGSPPIPLILQIQIGTKFLENLGQFIFDQSISEIDQKYYEQQKRLGVKQFYDIKQSQTAQIEEPFERQNLLYKSQISGVFVNDILSYKNIQTKYKFACVQNLNSLYQSFYNGVVVFDRLSDNIIDQMYNQNAIRTSDYILSGLKYNVQFGDSNITYNSIDITFDLDAKAEYYNTPSNPLVSNSDTFQIMSYGIYLNDEDISEKIMQKRIILDQITNQQGKLDDTVYIPSSLYQFIQNKYNIPEDKNFQNCAYCQCQEAMNLPEIFLMTEQYRISVKAENYIKKSENDCYITLYIADSFIVSSALLFHQNNKIMYQKQSNSIKIINAQLINHLELNSIIITFPIFSGLIFISLLYISLLWSLNFKQYKQEDLSFMKQSIRFELRKIQ
ncbi:transmembrane protein, putative (macronuclear) [Tetrahymena thermophila SB210]|uniref:Transmembrane protein, putative n=1 Tax=Tetrahymena thermophila (strain SB210) TaxID=312017 RepID=Q229F7_TETTS|nr:transmembrane protein, putative [Tetrahymena thermophila SB210]EAR81927.2 transmembrane protein, putative [Tetrahymena thermophila SB210]|eukprot:XP_001029590.2 transmembrane protein, putative [Tetrahymena thermophila SB210]